MVASGPRSGTTFAVKTAYYNGFYGWNNTANLAASDNSYASSSSSLSTADTDALSSVGFGFAIPGSATILGVICEIEIKGSSSRVQGIRLENAGVGIGSQKSPSTSLPGSDAYLSFGSASDMWGLTTATLTPAVVNSSTFGFWFYVAGTQGSAGVCTVDHVRITVHYQLPPTATSVSVYYNGYVATGPNNTPWYVSFTGQNGITTYQVRTANTTSTGTQVATGTAADGFNQPPIAYNASGLAQTLSTTLYLFVSNDSGTTWSPAYSLTFRRDDSIVAPSAISHSPNPIGASKQYTVTFNLTDTYSPYSSEMGVQVYTGANGTGTLVFSSQFTAGSGIVTSTVTDSTITNGATRYLRCRDGAGNFAETAFTVAYNPSISGTARLVLPFPIMKAQGAQYAATNFPLNAVPLDDFSGGDDANIDGRTASHLPSSIWQSPMPGHTDIVVDPAPLAITGGVLHGTSPAAWSSGLLSGVVNRITNPVEIYATHNSWQTNLMWLISTPGVGTTDGYMAAATATDIQVYRLDNGAFTILLTIPSVIQPGWKFGFRHGTGGLISVVSNRGGPNWLLEGTVSDNTYNTGQFGVFLPGPSASNFIDDLAATPIIPGASVLTLPFPRMSAVGQQISLIPIGDSKLILPFPTVSAAGKQQLISTSRLVLPSPLLISTARQDIEAQSRLILPTPVVSAAGKQKVISTSRLILPSPVMKTQGLQKDTGVARLITPFPVMFSSGLHTDIQAISRLIIPFPVLRTTGAVTFLFDHPYDTLGYGAWPYDSWPGQIAVVNPADATLTLPFPMMLVGGRQRIFDTGSILVSPFPVLATNGRQAIKAATVLTVPSPVMAATGLEKNLGISRLILPSPVMHSTGTHTDIQGISRLVLPFPVLRAIGAEQGGARSYLILPSPILRANGIQKDLGTSRLILPFPIVSGLGRQDIAAQARLITPFPVMVSSGRTALMGQARLILPSPLMHSTGRSAFKGQSILTAPFPVIITSGRQTYRAQARLILPFPILQGTGYTEAPPATIYNPVIQLEHYTGVLIIESYEEVVILNDYSGKLEIPDFTDLVQIPSESEVRSY